MNYNQLLVAALFILPAVLVNAQENEGEVIVIADLNREEVEQFIEEAEDQFYAIFNSSIDDDDYKITCRQEIPTGSNIPVRVCEPAFMIRARAENANTFGFNAGVVVPDKAILSSVRPEYERLQQMMEQMASEVPEFTQIASILTQLRARRNELNK